VVNATDNRNFAIAGYKEFRDFFGFDPKAMATIIITQCDKVMKHGDYI